MGPTAILDIGTSKIVCLVGERVHGDGILIRGVGIAPCSALVNDTIEDEAAFEEAVLTAIETAEKQSLERIREIALGVPTNFTKVVITEATKQFEGHKKRFTHEDDDDVLELAADKVRSDGYVRMHTVAVDYVINGIETAEPPFNVKTDQITARVSLMYVADDFIRLMERILSKLRIEIRPIVSTALAQTRHIIPRGDRVRPAVLIDVGAARTDVVLVQAETVIGVRSIQMGCSQFTGDLSFGLDLPEEYAENVKRRYMFLQEPLSSYELVRMPDATRKIDQSVITLVMEARAKELADLIREALKEMDAEADGEPTVFLTGGGSLMRGLGEFLRQELRLTVKRDMPSYMDQMNSPVYTSAFGGLDFALDATMERPVEPEREATGFWGKILGNLRQMLTPDD